jgi:hypothetical protein
VDAGLLCEADARIRTADPFITSEVLYQLSYVGSGRCILAGWETRFGRLGRGIRPVHENWAFRLSKRLFRSAQDPNPHASCKEIAKMRCLGMDLEV